MKNKLLLLLAGAGLVLLSASLSADTGAGSKEINFMVMGLGKPADVYERWKPFMNRLSEKTGHKIKLSVRQKLPRIIDMVNKGDVDFGFINSLVFYDFYKQNKVVPVAQMQNVEGNWFSNSIIFVRSDSNIKSLDQLKGKKVSFLGKASPGGYLAPVATMQSQGINTSKELEERFTMSVGKSIYDVILGNSEAAATCDVMYRLFSRKIDTGELKIIGRSGIYPENVVVAKNGMPKEVIEKFRKALIEMKDNPEDAVVFESLYDLKVGRFVPYKTETIEIIEKLKQEAQADNAPKPS